MTPEAQRIAIAEACGHGDYGTRMNGWRDEEIAGLPDYLNDLNAMHEAEKALLKIDDFCGYWETYSNVLTAKMGCMDIFHATAAQRAEAFLRTIGKWEASK